MDILAAVVNTYKNIAQFAPRIWFGLMLIMLVIMIWKIQIKKTWEFFALERNFNRDKFTTPWSQNPYGSTINRAVEQDQSAIGGKLRDPTYDIAMRQGFKSNREQPSFWETPAELNEYQKTTVKEGFSDDKLLAGALQGM